MGSVPVEERFLGLFSEVAPRLHAWAALRILPALRRRVDPEDVVQEVYCEAWHAFDRYDPARAGFAAWLFGIANHVFLWELRRQRRSRRAPVSRLTSVLNGLPDDATTLSRRLSRKEEVTALVDQVRTLSEREQQLFLYRGLEGLSYAEVADRLDISTDAAESRWRRLQERLRDRLPAFIAE